MSANVQKVDFNNISTKNLRVEVVTDISDISKFPIGKLFVYQNYLYYSDGFQVRRMDETGFYVPVLNVITSTSQWNILVPTFHIGDRYVLQTTGLSPALMQVVAGSSPSWIYRTISMVEGSKIFNLTDYSNYYVKGDTLFKEVTTGEIKLTSSDTVGYLGSKINTSYLNIVSGQLVVTGISGLLSTIAELNYSQGISSNIQTQLNTLKTSNRFEDDLSSQCNGSQLTFTGTQKYVGLVCVYLNGQRLINGKNYTLDNTGVTTKVVLTTTPPNVGETLLVEYTK